jgi:hypothetical protein
MWRRSRHCLLGEGGSAGRRGGMLIVHTYLYVFMVLEERQALFAR